MKRIKYASQNLDKNDIINVTKILRNDFITQGPMVAEFENKLKKRFGAKYCIVTSNGTSALKLSLRSLNLKSNDHVIVPSNTFVATANTVIANNQKIIIAPVNPNHGSLDEDCLKKTIKFAKLKKKKIKALINVFYAGQVWDVYKIYKICNKENIKIIDDACHAIGTNYKYLNKIYKVGSCKHSEITTFSFHSIKNITTAEGGCILTNNQKTYNLVKNLRSHGINRDKKVSLINKKNFNDQPWFYEAVELSENYRLSDLQCALGISQLKKLDIFKKYKNQIYNYYNKKIEKLNKYLIPISNNKSSLTHWHLYPVLINKDYIQKKKKLFLFLKEKNIFTQVHYVPIYKHPIYKDYYDKILNLESEKFYKSVISLPFHTKIKYREIDYIIDQISKFFK